MSMIPTPTRHISGQGNPRAKIFILGSFPDSRSAKEKRPFAGPSETVLEQCLHQAGLVKAEIYMYNFCYDRTYEDSVWNTRTKRPVTNITPYREALEEELEKINPAVIVPLGELATFAITGNGRNASIRGYASEYGEYRVVPSFPPSKMIFTNYIWRYYLAHDLTKAKRLITQDVLHPEVDICIPGTFEEARDRLQHLLQEIKNLSVDIEVSNFEVSCIGFSYDENKTLVIPCDERWTLEEETVLWRLMADILENPDISKTGQNFIFDMYFLMFKMQIFTKGYVYDTMVSHHIMYPDFLKGLEFLASIYTDYPYWKDMVNFKNIKKEA